MKRTGGTLNIRGSLEEKGLYPERIEQKFRSAVETPFSSLIEKIIHIERVVKLSRTEFNVVKKYYLLQKYRTPKTLIELYDKCNDLGSDYYPSLEEIRLEGESDYDLWIRLLAAGYKIRNIQEVLVEARVSENFAGRRGGKEYFERYKELRKQQHELGYTNTYEYMKALAFTYGMTRMPNALRNQAYKGLRLGKK